jgi:hypothetical protein
MDMIGNPTYDGGDQLSRKGAQFCSVYMTATMRRYLDFVRRFAARYDTNEKLAFVTSAEIPMDSMAKGPGYVQSVAQANMMTLAKEFPRAFRRTPSGILGAWWSHGGGPAVREQFAQHVLDSGGGFGFPDLDGNPSESHYNSHFRAALIANAGKWPSWQGVENADYHPDRSGFPVPNAQIASANRTGTNFIWWEPSQYLDQNGTGYNFDPTVYNYLRSDQFGGITMTCPTNISCAR